MSRSLAFVNTLSLGAKIRPPLCFISFNFQPGISTLNIVLQRLKSNAWNFKSKKSDINKVKKKLVRLNSFFPYIFHQFFTEKCQIRNENNDLIHSEKWIILVFIYYIFFLFLKTLSVREKSSNFNDTKVRTANPIHSLYSILIISAIIVYSSEKR